MTQASRLIFGFHATLAKLRHDPLAVRQLYVDRGRNDARLRDLLAQAERAAVRVLPVDPERLEALAPGARHQGVIAIVTGMAQQRTLDDVLDAVIEPPLLLVLDGVTDPHNLGACLRVADAAAAHAVVAPRDRAVGLTQTAVKVASGAAETVPYVSVVNLARTLRELKEREIWILGTDAAAPDSLYDAQWPRACAWVLGAEGEGLRRLTRETCDQLVRLPMLGSVASLNVAVAAGICLYETRRRFTHGDSAQTVAHSPGPRAT